MVIRTSDDLNTQDNDKLSLNDVLYLWSVLYQNQTVVDYKCSTSEFMF